jgi:phosphoglycerate dehydrogenase-like enzyme
MVSTAREIVLRANAATAAAIQAAHEQVNDGQAKDPAAVARNLQTVAGIATDKALLVEGRPTAIIGTGDLQSLIAKLGKQLGFDVDASANEITEAQELPPPA